MHRWSVDTERGHGSMAMMEFGGDKDVRDAFVYLFICFANAGDSPESNKVI